MLSMFRVFDVLIVLIEVVTIYVVLLLDGGIRRCLIVCSYRILIPQNYIAYEIILFLLTFQLLG